MTAWGMGLLGAAALTLLLAFWRRGARGPRWFAILLAIAIFFAGGILLFLGIVTSATSAPHPMK